MTRLTATIAAILALLTGLVLGQLGLLGMPQSFPVSSASTVSEQDLATARAFYDELNRFLATGERRVESMLATDFVDYAGSLPTGRNAEQFMASYSAIDSFFPRLQLEVVDLQTRGTLVAVRLEIHSGPASAIPGIPVSAPVANSAVEFLRIEHGNVAERWGSDNRLPGMAMTLSTDFDRTGPSLSGPAIQRFTLSAGQDAALSGDQRVMVRVVSGELRLNRVAVDQHDVAHPASDPVVSGQFRIVESTDVLLVRNVSHTAVVFLVFSLYGVFPVASSFPGTATVAAPAGIEAEALAYLPLRLAGPPSSRLRLSVTEVTLPVGAWMAPHTPGIVEEIVVLEGALEASVQSGRALVSAGGGDARPFDGLETASAGQGFSASSIATLSYRVAGAEPATLLIMTIEPALSPEANRAGHSE